MKSLIFVMAVIFGQTSFAAEKSVSCKVFEGERETKLAIEYKDGNYQPVTFLSQSFDTFITINISADKPKSIHALVTMTVGEKVSLFTGSNLKKEPARLVYLKLVENDESTNLAVRCELK